MFFVQEGRWRFFWGRHGTAGEVILEKGDIFDIPTGIFRGFENVGTEYGMIMAILGGDDAGGDVVWAPQVIEEARDHGLVLSERGKLYDTKRGQRLPESELPMQVLTEDELQGFAELPVEAVVPRFVARYQDMLALSARVPAKVIRAHALIRDRPGFEVDLCSRHSLIGDRVAGSSYETLMVHRGHWRLSHADNEDLLAPGDTCAIPPGLAYGLTSSMSGEAAVFRVRPTSDPAGSTTI